MSAQQVQPRPPQLQQHQQQQPWWAGPLNGIGSALQGVQHNLQQLTNNLPRAPGNHIQQQQSAVGVGGGGPPQLPRQPAQVSLHAPAVAPLSLTSSQRSNQQQHQLKPVTKEELGRATWTFLHTLAAQFPEHPTRQQQRDARQLIDSFTRIYPCADCAQHFQEIVRRDPPDVSSGATFSQWMCRMHNAVNRRLGKPTFSCDLVAARWAPLDCDEHNSCDMTVGRPR